MTEKTGTVIVKNKTDKYLGETIFKFGIILLSSTKKVMIYALG